jgi:multiple antibiotic resistance protein
MTPEALLNLFLLFLVVVDPIGNAPVFAGLTRGLDRVQQRRIAIRGVVVATAILLGFALLGERLLAAMHISVPAFKVAGGLLLFLVALDMVFARHSGLRSTTESEAAEARSRADLSVFPLAFPLLAGPAALTTILLTVGEARGAPPLLWALVGVVLVVMAVTLACLLAAGWLMRVLGETGANVVDRLLGVLLAALAVQHVVDGIKASFGLG